MPDNGSNQHRYCFQWTFLHPRYWATWLGLFCFFITTLLLPLALIDKISCMLGSWAAEKNKKRFNIAKVNLSLCFPGKNSTEIEQMVREHFRVQLRSVVHYFILWWRPAFMVAQRIHMSGFEIIEQYQQQGKKIIILLTHNVGLEFAVAAISMQYEMNGPYKVMRNPVINWLIVRSRMRFGKERGIKLFTREDGLRPLIRETQTGKILVYLGDEDLGEKNAVFTTFFGVQKATIPVLGRLAKTCDAVVLPCVSCYDEKARSYSVQLMPKIEDLPNNNADDEADSLKMNQAIEKVINICPAQYMWTLRYFQTRPSGEVAVYEN